MSTFVNKYVHLWPQNCPTSSRLLQRNLQLTSTNWRVFTALRISTGLRPDSDSTSLQTRQFGGAREFRSSTPSPHNYVQSNSRVFFVPQNTRLFSCMGRGDPSPSHPLPPSANAVVQTHLGGVRGASPPGPPRSGLDSGKVRSSPSPRSTSPFCCILTWLSSVVLTKLTSFMRSSFLRPHYACELGEHAVLCACSLVCH